MQTQLATEAGAPRLPMTRWQPTASPLFHAGYPFAPSHRFEPGLRRHLLAQSGVSERVVQRLEADGLGSLDHLIWCVSEQACGHVHGLADGLRNRRRALLRAVQAWQLPSRSGLAV